MLTVIAEKINLHVFVNIISWNYHKKVHLREKSCDVVCVPLSKYARRTASLLSVTRVWMLRERAKLSRRSDLVMSADKKCQRGLTTVFIAGRSLSERLFYCLHYFSSCLSARLYGIRYQTRQVCRCANIFIGACRRGEISMAQIKHSKSVLYKKILTSPFICTRFVWNGNLS